MKHLFTPGPASIHQDCLNIAPCFGRGDAQYQQIEAETVQMIQTHCQQSVVVPLQGSATLGLEIALRNLVQGHVLVILTGYYSQRLCLIANQCNNISTVTTCTVDQIPNGNFDWVIACPVETAAGFLTPIAVFREIANTTHAKLFLDATASVGLESGHDLADAMAFSSCKGLFGLTGAAFVAYTDIEPVGVDSYYLDLNTHINRGVTGPYHAMQSLHNVLQKHHELLHSVKINKQSALEKFSDYLLFDKNQQPLLSTAITAKITTASSDVVLYQPRDSGDAQSVICHLGELHLGLTASAHILNNLILHM